MNKFWLKRFVIRREPFLELTAEEFEGIKEAQRRVNEALALEDSFNLMLGNYEEFEQELLSIALKRVISESASWEWDAAIDTLSLASRRLANLLTTAKAYEDRARRTVSRWYGETEPARFDAIKEYFSHEYDAALGYRVCYELRNHAQHGGAAVHSVSTEPIDTTGPDGLRVHATYTFAPSISVEEVREDFKPRVVAELDQGGQVWMDGARRHDLRPFVRIYVSALGRVHVKLRALVADEVAKNDATISDAVQRYCSLPGAETSVGLCVMEVNERGVREGRRPSFVSEKPIERRRGFEKRNDSPVRFDKMLVSNIVKPRDE